MKPIWKYILAAAVFLIGLSVLFYPAISNYLHVKHQVGIISNYEKSVDQMSMESKAAEKAKAHDYNEKLAIISNKIIFFDGEIDLNKEYYNILNINSVMGFIKIPEANITLSLKHGTTEDVLADSCGHIKSSSLPVGGPSTHCVLSAHRGLPAAKLFTDIDKLKVDDTFYLYILDDVLAYRVFDIDVVLPEQVDSLRIENGRDLCTLVTCTPYGINTHRLLIHAERTEYIPEVEKALEEQNKREVNKHLIYYAIGIAVTILIFIILFIIMRKKRKKQG